MYNNINNLQYNSDQGVLNRFSIVFWSRHTDKSFSTCFSLFKLHSNDSWLTQCHTVSDATWCSLSLRASFVHLSFNWESKSENENIILNFITCVLRTDHHWDQQKWESPHSDREKKLDTDWHLVVLLQELQHYISPSCCDQLYNPNKYKHYHQSIIFLFYTWPWIQQIDCFHCL